MSQGATIDYGALAKQAGATSSMPTPSMPARDYAALAKIAGAINSTAPNAAQKMVSPKGEVLHVAPEDVQGYKAQGYTFIAPDGSFYPQNIPGEDPLETEKRRERIFNALTPQEQQGHQANSLKEFGKTGIESGLATAAGVMGASGLGAATDSMTTFLGEVGKEIAKKYAGETAAKVTADFLTANAGKLVAGGGLAGYLIHKLTSEK
jgi:hypothetical protein